MHRTYGDGWEPEGGTPPIHRFIDQNLPVVPGTVDTAEYNNAVQEEICNVILMTGGQLNSGGSSDPEEILNGTPAADRAAGWHQLYDAIFQSSHITDSAIDELTFGVIAPPIYYVDGGFEWYQDEVNLQYTDGTRTHGINASGLAIIDTGDTTRETDLYMGSIWLKYQNRVTNYTGQGIRFIGGPGDTSFGNRALRKSLFALTSVPWTQFTDSNGDQQGIYNAVPNYVTDIPDSVQTSGVYAAWVQYLSGSGWQIVPALAKFGVSGGFLRVEFLSISTGVFTAPGSSCNLILEYDAITVS